MRAKFGILAGAAAFLAGPPLAHAAVVTFAQYTQQNPDIPNQTFTVAGNGKSATFRAVTPTTGDPVYFSFEGLPGLPSDLLARQTAFLKINAGAGAVTTAAASKVTFGPDTFLLQPFSQAFTLSFIRSSDYIYKGHDYGTNLLTISIAPATSTAELIAQNHASSASMSFDNASYDVTFSSGFLTFAAGSSEDGALAFSGAVPTFSLGKTFLNNFRVDSTGTFDSDPEPLGIIVPIPEPAGIAAFGGALFCLGLARRRFR